MKKFTAKKATVCLVLFLFVKVIASAQGITGKVMDEQNEPIEFANIVLLSPADSSFVQGTISHEDGSFRLAASSSNTYIIKVSSIGYQSVCRPTQAGKTENLILPGDAVMLGETVITAKRPDYQVKDGNLVTRIENSVLSQSGTANDVLKHIPGLQEKDGEFTVFGKGMPVIYINGREVHDASELDCLNSADIRRVEVITNPGARYGADVKSVVRIRTVKQTGEGMGVDARSTWGQSENTKLNEQLNLNYRHNNFDVFGTFRYAHHEYLLTRHVTQNVFVDTLWQQRNGMKEFSMGNDYKGEIGMNYQISDNQSLGIRYSLAASPKNKMWYQAESDIMADGNYYDYLLSSSASTTVKKPAHQVSTYYSATLGKLTVDFNADALWSKVNTENEVQESSQEQESRTMNSTNRVDNRLYAGKLILSHPLAGGSFSFGSEFTSTRRNDLFINPQEILPSTDSYIKENRTGVFAEYNRFIKIAYLNMGLRYEYVSSERSYANFFPNISLATQIGKFQTQLSYTAKTKRPYYYQLSSNMSYMNRFTYMSGNPALKPETIHDLTLSGSYRWLQFMISYQREKDAILYITDQYEKNPAITIITHRNFDRIDNLSTFLTAAPTIGCWHPQLTAGIQKQWAEVEHSGETLSMNKPLFFSTFNNGIQLPHHWTLSLDMSYQSKGDYQNIYIYRHVFMMNAAVTKSFLDDRLSLNLQGIDLTRGRTDGNRIYNKQMNMDVTNAGDSREVRLTVRYKFNATKSKYKGKGAAGEEIKRL
ncbi:outer membrane beta-barrel protein [Phocaeicola sp.]